MITGLLFALPRRAPTPANDDLRLDAIVPKSGKLTAANDKAALGSLERALGAHDADPNKAQTVANITRSQGAVS